MLYDVMSDIRVAKLLDVPFLIDLQRKESNALGFLPRMALEQRVERGRVFIAEENDEPAAFVLFDVAGRHATIHQACAVHDARRRGLCTALADRVRGAAGRRGAAVVHLACGSDLDEALAFWPAAGFARVGQIAGGRARRRDLVLFEAPTLSPTQLELNLPLPRPAPRPLNAPRGGVAL